MSPATSAFCPGRRQLSDPDPVSRKRATPDGPLEPDLEKYFDAPADLLQRCRYRWLTKDLRLGTGPIDVDVNE